MALRASSAALVGLLVVLAPAVALGDPSPATAAGLAVATTPAGTTPIATTPIATTPPTTPGGHDEAFEAEAAQQVLVRFRPDVPSSTRLALIAKAGGALDSMLALDDTALVDMDGSIGSALSWFALQGQILWAEPNALVHADNEIPYKQDDPFFTKQWSLENYGNDGRVFDADIDALGSWFVSKGSGATVGVVDTGVDAGHADLAGQLVDGVNFMPDGRATTADGSGHGTHVTGIIAARENTIGIVGAAPAAKVQPLRALDDSGTGTSATIASAFAYAGKEGLRVVNASLGSTAPSKAVFEAIAAYPNTLFVVAAGNAGVNIDNGGGANYPCQYDLPNIICVGASDDRDQPATFSNRGTTSIDLSAPGTAIISTAPGGDYRYESGTSMAAPMVSAVAALVSQIRPNATGAQLRAQIIQTVDQPISLRGVSLTGGRLNSARAVGLFVGPDGQRPGTVTGAVGVPGVGTASLSWDPISSVDLGVYQVEVLRDRSWAQQTVVFDGTTVSISGLTPGVPVSYRIRGIDRSGEEGDPSAVITVTPRAAAAEGGTPTGAASDANKTNATKATTKSTPGTAGSNGAAGTVAGTSAILSGVKRTKKKGRVSAVAFKLSAAGQVTVTASSASGGNASRAVITKTFSLAAGQRAVKFGSGTPALRLKKGTWRITLATKANKVSLKVAIR